MGKNNSQSASTNQTKAPVLHYVIVLICSIATAILMVLGATSMWVNNISDGDLDNPTEPKSVKLYTATTTSDNNDANRQTNIALACAKLNGVKIAPNETFSINNVLGNIADNNEFLVAPAIQENVSPSERGGGVSQVVSTFYHAAACVGMRIDEHHAHALAIDFTPLGFDAMVSYGTLDLKVTNTNSKQMFIEAEASGSTVTVSIIGEDDSRKTTYALSSNVTDSYLKNVLGAERLYYTITTSRLKYENGVYVSSETIDSNTYEAVDVAFTVSPISGA